MTHPTYYTGIKCKLHFKETEAEFALRYYQYPSGEVQILLPEYCRDIEKSQLTKVEISFLDKYTTTRHICLLQLQHWLEQFNLPVEYITCYMPYIPFCRQDYDFEANGYIMPKMSDIFSDMTILTNSLHSIGGAQAYSNTKVLDNEVYTFIKNSLEKYKPSLIIFPDTSSKTRFRRLLPSDFKNTPIITLIKSRNKSTGQVESVIKESDVQKLQLIADNSTNDALILDDICDGGSTLNNAAKVIDSALRGTKFNKEYNFIGCVLTLLDYNKEFSIHRIDTFESMFNPGSNNLIEPVELAKIIHAQTSLINRPDGTTVRAWRDLPVSTQRKAIEAIIRLSTFESVDPELCHTTWADPLIAEGWTVGPYSVRDRTHPSLIPYVELPQSEKDKDIIWANSINLFKARLKL